MSASGAAAALAAGPSASASLSHGALELTLRYPMTCGRPGPGPLVIRFPTHFRIASPSATVDGKAAAVTLARTTLTVALARPPQHGCGTVDGGVAVIRITTVHAPRPGVYVLHATVRELTFDARLRVR